jgi:Protein of unknown function (DUF2974).
MQKNIIDYVANNMQTFEECPFNNVDSLVLSQLSYYNFEVIDEELIAKEQYKCITIRDLLKAEVMKPFLITPWNVELSKKFIFNLAASPRFRNIGICSYSNVKNYESEMQFSAITFILDKREIYIALRGTDSSFVGWKENLNMAFMSPVPAQIAAKNYLTEVANCKLGKIRIGGHSKGGNLAIYSAIFASESIKNRLIEVYSHDGPGFPINIVKSKDYINLQHKIDITLPQSSLVGLLLENHTNYKVIKSNRISILQHDPYSWAISDNSFIYVENVKDSAYYMDLALNEWINSLKHEEREEFVNVLYDILNASGSDNFRDLIKNPQISINGILDEIKNMDENTKFHMSKTIKILADRYFSIIKEVPRNKYNNIKKIGEDMPIYSIIKKQNNNFEHVKNKISIEYRKNRKLK